MLDKTWGKLMPPLSGLTLDLNQASPGSRQGLHHVATIVAKN